MQRFLIFGHRGSPRRFPENTLASFDEALRSGADGFETDLRLLSDRTAILYHDDELEDYEIEGLSTEQVTEHGAIVERLDSLAPYASRGRMILEVKRSKWEETLLERIEGWQNVVVASFDHSTITDLRRRGVSFPLGITVFGYMLGLAAYAREIGVEWVFPGFRYVDREMVESLHEHGIKVVPWTPNRVREWERLRDIGCDGIITDLPGEAVEWRGRN